MVQRQNPRPPVVYDVPAAAIPPEAYLQTGPAVDVDVDEEKLKARCVCSLLFGCHNLLQLLTQSLLQSSQILHRVQASPGGTGSSALCKVKGCEASLQLRARPTKSGMLLCNTLGAGPLSFLCV